MAAQKLAQTRPGAARALFFHSRLPLAEFGGTWLAAALLTERVIGLLDATR